MSGLSCDEVRDRVPELALGALDGAERGAVLAHLAGCVECRLLTEELSQAVDSLLLLAPEAEPSLGFESRVVAHLGLGRRRWRRPVVLAVAAVAVALLAVGVHLADRGVGVDHQEPLAAQELRTGSGQRVGEVFAYRGDLPWVFMTVDSPKARGAYDCYLTLVDGTSVRLGHFTVVEGTGSWGRRVRGGQARLRSVRLVRTGGATVATADFS